MQKIHLPIKGRGAGRFPEKSLIFLGAEGDRLLNNLVIALLTMLPLTTMISQPVNEDIVPVVIVEMGEGHTIEQKKQCMSLSRITPNINEHTEISLLQKRLGKYSKHQDTGYQAVVSGIPILKIRGLAKALLQHLPQFDGAY